MRKRHKQFSTVCKRLVTWMLILAMVLGLVPGGLSLNVKADGEPLTVQKAWDYSIEFTRNTDDSTYLNADFNAYNFKDYNNTAEGSYEPSALQSVKNQGVQVQVPAWRSNDFFTNDNSQPGSGYLRPAYNNRVNLLTYAKESYENFYVEYSFYAGAKEWGLAFGAEKGQFPITWDGNSSNDTGVALFFKNTETMYVGGAIDLTQPMTSPVAGKEIKTYAAATNTNTDIRQYVANADAVRAYFYEGNTEPNNKNKLTMCVEVKDKVLKVWEKSAPTKVFEAKLTDNYQGGYVSLVSNYRQNGGFADFAIRRVDWDYSIAFHRNTDQSSYLDADFDAYNFKDYNNTAAGSYEPSALQSVKNQGVQVEVPAWRSNDFFMNDSSQDGSGYLRPAYNNRVNLLTYAKQSYENFYAEYSFFAGGYEWGFAFGAEKGQFPISWDGNSSNDTGVAMYFKNTETLYIGGAIDLTEPMKSPVAGKEIKTYPAATNTNTDSRKYVANADAARVHFYEGDTAPDNDDMLTMCVEVKDKVLKVWEKSAPTKVFEVKLTDNYQGGYLSLVSNYRQNGGFVNFSVKGLASSTPTPPPTPPVDPMDEVAEQFDAYYLTNAATSTQMEAVDVKANWQSDGERLLPTRGGQGTLDTEYGIKKIEVLTFKEKAYTDFELTYTYNQSYSRIGVIFGAEKGAFPIGQYNNYMTAEGGILFAMEAEGNPIAHGDFVNGYTNESIVQRRLTGLQLENFKDGSGNTTLKDHTIKIVVKDKDAYVYIDNRTEPIMYLALPDSYAGGYVSLFTAGNNQYGFTDYAISDQITTVLPEKETADNLYTIDFTALHGAKELANDFVAYQLDNIEDETVEKTPQEMFDVVGKGIRRNATKKGDDSGAFHILTLKNKEYKNFELELTFGQSRHRYGVMFGGELGEFAVYDGGAGVRGTEGMAFAYTEAEGYRNIRGGLAAGMMNDTNNHAKRVATDLASFSSRGSVTSNVDKEVLHTMKIRVVGDWMTMVIDDNEDSRVTVRLDGYTGGYISLVSNGRMQDPGCFNYLKIVELGDDAQLGDPNQPAEKEGFVSLAEMEEEFDAYYVADAKESSKMEKKSIADRWWFNKNGFLARFKNGNGSETEKVDVLTYKKKAAANVQIEFDYQQTYDRTGIIIGGEKGIFPIGEENDARVANGGVMLFLEAQGQANAMGDFTNGYTSKNELRRRLTNLNLGGFVDSEGSADENTNSKNPAVHHITIVIKNKELYLFADGSDRCALYLTLPDDYNGGYVSLFSSGKKDFGLDNLVISETITQSIPKKEKLVTKSGNNVTIDFDVDVPDATGLQAYYLKKLNKKGTLEQRDLYSNWVIANGTLRKEASNIGTNDAEKVAVLTYTEQTYENFVATFEYKLTRGRLMFLFGTENGKYPLYYKGGHKENGGVMLYAEADLGSGGGICALGNVKVATEGYRPMYRELSYAPGYYEKNSNDPNKLANKTYTMTVAVMNKHCSVYIDGFGLVASFDLSKDYKGGYISLASTNAEQRGFGKVTIKPITDANAIKSVAANKDITVKTGTDLATAQAKLPATVSVTNAQGKTVKVPVKWTAQGYDGTKEGEYSFVGSLTMQNGMTNPGKLSAEITVRVRDKITGTGSGTKFWTFDTNSDLLDFKSYYIKNAKKDKPVASEGPSWFVRGGKLQRDQNRASGGGETSKLSILTYTGQTYKNFELEVDFSQQYAREMIMFGSKTPGQYINYEDTKSKENPICVFVEFEGKRNALGNVENTNFYNRTSTSVSNAREDYAENNKYYNKKNKESSVGKMHHLKLRVVGDTFTIWLDNQETVFSGKIGEGYTGGYISLVSTAQKGKFDNLKITRLNEAGQPMTDNLDVAATDNLNVDYVKLEKPQEVVKEDKNPIDIKKILILGVPTVALVALLTGVTVLMVKNKNKKKEGNK